MTRSVPVGLLVSDVDSTFLTQEVIELVAELAGAGDLVREVTERAMCGEIDFEQSLRDRVSTLAGLSVEALVRVRDQLVPTPGALELFARARDHGWVTALVSGGFHEAIDELAERAGVDHVVAHRFEVVGERLTGRVEGPIVDRKAKASVLRSLAGQYGLGMSQTVAIGDGANDIDLLSAAGTGIAFRAKPALRAVADVCLDGPGLLDAWPWLEDAARSGARRRGQEEPE